MRPPRSPTPTEAAPWLERLRAAWPHWGIVYDGTEWWALLTLNGRRTTLRAPSGIELEARMQAFR
ncbi:hypothetical protein [Actinomadura kijaniata]|uniref:hypothetical protein n=1 Tax=Actinomadura kijaniata TaxID=46161 RepID=UPI000833F236|nr:hypothetical protein [Actinomadura kijaniata]